MSLQPTTSRRDIGVIVGVDSNPENTTMLNDYDSRDSEESAQNLPLVPRAYSQLRKPCLAAVEGEENSQASPSVPNTSGHMRRPSIVVPRLRPDDATDARVCARQH
ncbi:hypothetical protein G4B88_009602 [Cannabis sativa]|uniref:Uncharacterized protein n=1 Tax=Cannabis sativa TaxID=3483 RepID=A0A7J6DKP5_CANSA|nr:hypothetical protein G4B88_009602 [Cannabis sativa]